MSYDMTTTDPHRPTDAFRDYLEEEVTRLAEAVSRGYARRDPRPQRTIGKSTDV